MMMVCVRDGVPDVLLIMVFEGINQAIGVGEENEVGERGGGDDSVGQLCVRPAGEL